MYNEDEGPEEFSINNPKWREEPGLFDDVLVMDNGFEMCRYDVLLGVEKLTPYLRSTQNRYPTINDIFVFGCMLLGE